MISKLPYTGLGQSTNLKVRLNSTKLSEFGEALPLAAWSGKGDFFESAKEAPKTSNPASSKSQHASLVLINGDPFDIKDDYVSGEIEIDGKTYRISKFKRRRNPDGTVHHVLFEVE